MNRRSFLALGAKAVVGLCLAQATPAWASIPTIPIIPTSLVEKSKKPRSLSFYHTHTKERLNIIYAKSGEYDPKALVQINNYLRDFRTSEVHTIDPAVLDILWTIQQKMCCNRTYEVISGYRSPKTNEQLRKRTTGVAKRSLHMKGQAIDVRITGEKTKTVRDCAISLKSGGVGYYAKSNFVHLDTGRVRFW
ncbi:MAG: DUF882 domain-containing protein [Candidatus Electrothrix sp. AW3_4]|jgi:uncharacterized protein YcbK (DUF882 family)|nr:DUF882 domain-containing protein [Candidatus Electrothrix gigas]